jgi:regulator of replication initiation timing
MVLLVVLWILYNRYVKKIIDDLIGENTALELELDKLKVELAKLKLKLNAYEGLNEAQEPAEVKE